MAEKVKLSKDGASIEFALTNSIPATLKKFRHSPEIEGFYRFIFENDLQKEAYEILDRIIVARKAIKTQARKDAKEATKEAAKEAAAALTVAAEKLKATTKPAKISTPPPTPAPKTQAKSIKVAASPAIKNKMAPPKMAAKPAKVASKTKPKKK